MIDWVKKNKERLSGLGLLLLLVYFVGGLLYVNIYEPSQLRKHGRYTVATTSETYMVVRGGRKVKFYFNVNGQTYEGRWGKMDFIIPDGEKYLIKYSEKDPDINERVYNYPVPAEFRIPPDSGWTKLPY